MKIRLVSSGINKVTVIKEIRAAYGNNLKDAKVMTDKAPIDLSDLNYEAGIRFVRTLREAGVRQPRPWDRRLEILAAVKSGERVVDVANRFGGAWRTIYVWMAKERSRG